jgi:hypothetical protein
LSRSSLARIAKAKISSQSKKIKKETRGRKRKTDQRDERIIKRVIKQHRNASWYDIGLMLANDHEIILCPSTIRNRANEMGIKTYRATKKAKLTKRKVEKRKVFARSKRKWPTEK